MKVKVPSLIGPCSMMYKFVINRGPIIVELVEKIRILNNVLGFRMLVTENMM